MLVDKVWDKGGISVAEEEKSRPEKGTICGESAVWAWLCDMERPGKREILAKRMMNGQLA